MPLLTAIGIDHNTDIDFTNLFFRKLITKYHVPTLTQSKALLLEYDIQYQIDQITLHGSTKRTLLIAEDNTRWQLN